MIDLVTSNSDHNFFDFPACTVYWASFLITDEQYKAIKGKW